MAQKLTEPVVRYFTLVLSNGASIKLPTVVERTRPLFANMVWAPCVLQIPRHLAWGDTLAERATSAFSGSYVVSPP